jgi:hypothetical protein
MRYKLIKNPHFVYLSGKPMIPYLLRYRGLAVAYYSFALGRLGSGASSTFAQLGLAYSFFIFLELYLQVHYGIIF